jgi:hypothetical protein
MISSGKHALVDAAISAFGTDAVFAATCSFMERVSTQQAADWMRATSGDKSAVATVLRSGELRNADTLEALSRFTGPDDVPNDIGVDPWVTAAKAVTVHSSSGLSGRHYLTSYLLARALGTVSRSKSELFRIGFDDVYGAASRGQLPEEAWRLIERRLPRVKRWREWDYCARLVEAVVDEFVSRRLDPSVFAELTLNDNVFARLVDVGQRSVRGRRFLRRVANALSKSVSRQNTSRMRLLMQV